MSFHAIPFTFYKTYRPINDCLIWSAFKANSRHSLILDFVYAHRAAFSKQSFHATFPRSVILIRLVRRKLTILIIFFTALTGSRMDLTFFRESSNHNYQSFFSKKPKLLRLHFHEIKKAKSGINEPILFTKSKQNTK